MNRKEIHMEDRNIPYAVICHNYLDMDIKFHDFQMKYADVIHRVSKTGWRIELKDGHVFLFVTAANYYDKNRGWAQGRVYRILGNGRTVYSGMYPYRGITDAVM